MELISATTAQSSFSFASCPVLHSLANCVLLADCPSPRLPRTLPALPPVKTLNRMYAISPSKPSPPPPTAARPPRRSRTLETSSRANGLYFIAHRSFQHLGACAR